VASNRLDREPRLQYAHQLFHPAQQRSELTAGARAAVTKCSHHTTVAQFSFDETRKEGSDRQRFDVARVDSAEERLRDRMDSLVSEPPSKKCAHRLVITRRPPRNNPIESHPRASANRQQIVGHQTAPRGRNAEHRGRGKRAEPTVVQDKRGSWRRG